MANEDQSPICFLALPRSLEYQAIKETIRRAVRSAGFRSVSAEDVAVGEPIATAISSDIAKSDCIVVDFSLHSSNVIFELGLAQAMGKRLYLLAQAEAANTIPSDLRGISYLKYDDSSEGLSILAERLKSSLLRFRRSPQHTRIFPEQAIAPFVVDWDRLSRADAENLCLELLIQTGYKKVNWVKGSHKIDLIAELPKNDPDGFEYKELWLITMGRNTPVDELANIVTHKPEFLLYSLINEEPEFARIISRENENTALTLLIILLEDDRLSEVLAMRLANPSRLRRIPLSDMIRIRVWDRGYLTSLVYRFPQIGYKYFSDEARSTSKYRKTPEELYRENMILLERQVALTEELQDEKNQRIRAERDAIWKDISFSAAHKIGNPIFAIETNLGPLQKRITEQRTEEALEVVADITASVEKAKTFVDQFKSLAKAQKIEAVPTLLEPLLEDACKTVQGPGITCTVKCPQEIKVLGDPERLAECFDELIMNSIHWCDKTDKEIYIEAVAPAPPPLPDFIDSSRSYALIHFKDNGAGVQIENKNKIFDAFYTTRDHGTGLGLALVHRIIEAHSGGIREIGFPDRGADFEIYLPLAEELTTPATRSTRTRASRHNG